MRVHHLNCGTLRPLGGRLVNGDRLPLLPARLVCHCLLIERDDGGGLVLVDTGFGTTDTAESILSLLPGMLARDRGPRLEMIRGLYARLGTRARLDPEETAVRQLATVGHSPGDVSDIVLTHLDLDHAGGLPDFPNARVHLLEAELRAALEPDGVQEQFRYAAGHWAHGPEWRSYEPTGEWFGFDAVTELEGLPGFALVSLPGHSRGHAGVAVRLDPSENSGREWLLHAGDAYFFHGEADPDSPHSTPGLAGFQARFEVDGEAGRETRHRLRALRAEHGDRVEFFCTHDPVELERLQTSSTAGAPSARHAVGS
jgi:glyoxylase-like metal-dependent hydrolase (beta-lactamase superfamily II)